MAREILGFQVIEAYNPNLFRLRALVPSQEALEEKELAPIPSRIPISASGPETTRSLSPPIKTIKRVQPGLVIAIQDENPWLTYK
jgi:hypothetical protein